MNSFIKEAEPSDIEFVKQIEIECGLSGWSRADYLEEIKRPDSLFFVFIENREIVGFIVARLIMNLPYTPFGNSEKLIENTIGNEIEIYNIAVAKNFRSISAGSALISKTFESAKEHNVCKIHLEVRKSNTGAIKFYRKHGFEIIGERRNFYKNPSEDALLMCFILSA